MTRRCGGADPDACILAPLAWLWSIMGDLEPRDLRGPTRLYTGLPGPERGAEAPLDEPPLFDDDSWRGNAGGDDARSHAVSIRDAGQGSKPDTIEMLPLEHYVLQQHARPRNRG